MMEEHAEFTYIWHLFGYDVQDMHGTSVGPVARLWTDNTSGTLRFLGFRTGWVPRVTRVIRAGDAEIDDATRTIRVPHAAAWMRCAPIHNSDLPLSRDQERTVAAHYDQ